MDTGYTVEYEALTTLNEDLCNALPINDLFPSLISNRVIDFNDKAEICSESNERRRVDMLISKLIGGMKAGNNEKFYKFIEVMKKSPKCTFLVNRMELLISQHQTSDIDMKLVHKHVIPRISAEWETVSAYLEYSVQIKNSIRAAHRGFPKECCAALIEDWIGSDNGVKPKTWKTLIEVLSEISELTLSTKQIKECLYQAGVLGGQKTSHPTNKVSVDLENTSQVVQSTPSVDYHDYYIDDEKILELQRELLTTNTAFIVHNLNPDDIVDQLVSHHLVGHSARERLNSYYKTPSEKNRIIVEQVSSGEPGAVDKFCEILKKNRRTNYISEKLEKEWRALLSKNSTSDDHHVPSPLGAAPVAPPTTTHTRTPPSDQGAITPGSDRPASQSYQCSDDIETTTPVTESVEGYWKSTGAKPNRVEIIGAKHSAFIMYAKEDHDPNGDQVLMLSDVLRHAGVDCDIDLYHINENIQDWSHWTSLSIHYCVAKKDYILLVCSPRMIALLEETGGNPRINMCAGYIDRLTLRNLIQQHTNSFVPLIDPSVSNVVPPVLSGKTTYHLSFSRMPQNISIDRLLDHPDFTSLRSLVATLSGQQENPPPDVGLPGLSEKDGIGNQQNDQQIPPGPPLLKRYDLTQPPSTNVHDSKGPKPPSESVTNSTTDTFTQPEGYPPHDENGQDKTSLTDKTDQPERKDTELENSSDDDYKECDNDDGGSEPVETPHPSLDQIPSDQQEEPSSKKSHENTTPQPSVTPSYIGTPKKPPSSPRDHDDGASPGGRNDGSSGDSSRRHPPQHDTTNINKRNNKASHNVPPPSGDEPRPSPDDNHDVPSLDENIPPAGHQLVDPVQPNIEDNDPSLPVNDDPNRPTLQQLNNHVRHQAALKWYDLGVELLSADKIDVINHNNPGNVENSCTEMFKIWLREDTEASWVKLVNALRAPSVGLHVLADEIERKFVYGSQDNDDSDDDNDDGDSPMGRESSDNVPPPPPSTGHRPRPPPHDHHDVPPLEDNEHVQPVEDEKPVEPIKPVEPEQPVRPVHPPVNDDDGNPSPPASPVQESTPPAPADAIDVPLLLPEDSNTANNKHNIYKLFDGLIWTTLTCTAGGLGYYVINGHMNNDGVAAVTGAVCGVTTGALLAVCLNRD